METIATVMNQKIGTPTSSTLMKCDVCGQPRQKIIEIMGNKRVVPIGCTCTLKQFEDDKKHSEQQEKQERLKRVFKNSLMDEKLFNSTFDNWDHNKADEKLYRISKKYADNFKDIKQNNIGLLIYGEPGNGKTYASSSIANELLKQGITVICVSMEAILQRIKMTFNNYGQEGQFEIIKSLENADLLILDDLGVETKTEWSIATVYSIIDARYRVGLPIVITTNIDIRSIPETYGKRTGDRINEMCTVIQATGNSLRKDIGNSKRELLKQYLKG